ncbi:MAG: alpha/beta fold hydrolase [Elusimicrobiota bacterium]
METFVKYKVHGQYVYGIWHYPERKKSRPSKVPAILMCHGFTGNKSEAHMLFTKFARRLAKQGVAVLRIDFRCSGDSEGDFKDMTITGEITDAVEGINFLKTLSGVDTNRIGIMGLSLGGFVTFMTANKLPEIVKYAVLWSAVADPKFILTRTPQVTEDIRRKGYHLRAGNALTKPFIDDIYQFPAIHTMPAYTSPVLVVHGDNDKSIPLTHAGMYARHFKHNGNLFEMKVIAGADHTYSSPQLEDKVYGITEKWIKKVLRGL